MKATIVFLLFIAIAFAQKQNMTRALEDEAITALTQEMNQIVQQYASANASGLISNSSGQTGAAFWTCEKQYLNQTLQGFPQKVIEEFNNIMFSSSTEFESFNTQIESNYTYVYELVGTAKANSTDVAIGIAYVASIGTTIPQYNTTKECSKCWLVKTCCKEVKTPIGFTTTQQDTMVDFLIEEGYKVLLNHMPQLSQTDNMDIDIPDFGKKEVNGQQYDQGFLQ